MERNIAIMIASVPAMRPLIEPFLRVISRAVPFGRNVMYEEEHFELQNAEKLQKDIEQGEHPFRIGKMEIGAEIMPRLRSALEAA